MNDTKETIEVSIAASQSLEERKYWLEKLSGTLHLSHFPYDFKISDVTERLMDSIDLKLPAEISSQLLKLSNQSDRRLHMILTATVVVLLARYTANSDIIISTPIEKQEFEGDFVNTVLVLRHYLEKGMTFKDLLLQARTTIMEAADNQNYPMETLLFDLALTSNGIQFPLFDVAVLVENIHDKKYILNVHPNIIFSFLRKDNGEVDGTMEYHSQLYERPTAERIVNHLKRVLHAVLFDVNHPLDRINLLTETDREQLVYDFNNKPVGAATSGIPYPAEKTIHQLFEEQVERTPDKDAVIFEEESLTYRQLNEKANRLAYSIKLHGVTPNTAVGIMVERSLEMVVGMMAILKAGGTYVAIDPEYPLERIKYMIEDSSINLLLTDNTLDISNDFDGQLIDLHSAHAYQQESSNPKFAYDSSKSAYIIYTSGSTGKPKGVVVEHRSIVNTLHWSKNYYRFDHTDAILQIPSFAFDSSVTDIFCPLISGAALVLIREQNRLDMAYLTEQIKKNQVTHFLIIPNFYRAFLKEIPETLKGLKSITVAGDNSSQELVKEHFEKIGNVRLYNEYGPAENSVCSTAYEFTPENTRVLIGKPISNVNCYILDRDGQLNPVGIPGELCLSGPGLARGYFGKPGLTDEKFVENPNVPGERMYKTGDLGRWLPDGNIEFLGRIDNQVKIRGVRIETGEIENQMLKHEDIAEAVVVAKTDNTGEKYLCAYIVRTDKEQEWDVTKLVDFLKVDLPEFILPTYIFELDEMPVTPNGKIDRKKLHESDDSARLKVEYVPPRNETERILAEIWQKELGLEEEVGIHHNYFNIGGDSIKSIGLVNEMNEKLTLNLKVTDLYANNTIEKLAAMIDDLNPESVMTDSAGYDEALKELEDFKQKIIQEN
jgi:amino acid adenylation domain-containing protein